MSRNEAARRDHLCVRAEGESLLLRKASRLIPPIFKVIWLPQYDLSFAPGKVKLRTLVHERVAMVDIPAKIYNVLRKKRTFLIFGHFSFP